MTGMEYTAERLRSEVVASTPPDLTPGTLINNIGDASKVDVKGSMYDCYVSRDTEATIGEGSLVIGCSFTGEHVSIGKDCIVVDCKFNGDVEIGDNCSMSNCLFSRTPYSDSLDVKVGDGCVMRGSGFESAGPASLEFGTNARVFVPIFDIRGTVRFGSDCSIVGERISMSNCLVGDRFCFDLTNNRGFSGIEARRVHIGNDVRIIGMIRLNGTREIRIEDRSLVSLPTEYNATLNVVDLSLGTESVLVFNCEFYSRRQRVTIKVGGRGRLELNGKDHYYGSPVPREIVVAPNEKATVAL